MKASEGCGELLGTFVYQPGGGAANTYTKYDEALSCSRVQQSFGPDERANQIAFLKEPVRRLAARQ